MLFITQIFSSAVASDVVPDHYEIRASTTEFNRLVFPEPYSQIVIPPDAALQEAPVPLADYRGLLIRPLPGAKDIPVFVQLISGSSFTVRLVPATSSEGAVFRYKQAEDLSKKPNIEERPEDSWIARTILAVYEGKTPQGFEAIVQPEHVELRYQGNGAFNLVFTPVAQYQGGRHRLKVYRLSSKKLINVEPRDFYKEGLIAAAVESDVVSPGHSPLLVVLEALDE